MIEAREISYSYGAFPAVDGASICLEKGKVSGLLGPNGAGKTTLLRCLSGLLKTDRGEILVDNERLSGSGARSISRKIAFLAQESSCIFPYLCRDMVLMGRNPHISPLSFGPSVSDKREAARAIEFAGIERLAKRPFNELSGGERQLVLIARAIAQRAGHMILDEPALNLDLANQARIFGLIRRLASEEGASVLFSTHDPNHIFRYCDRCYIMDRARLEPGGTPEEIVTQQTMRKHFGLETVIVEIGGKKGLLPA